MNPRIDTISKFGIFLQEELKEKKTLQEIHKRSPHSYVHTRTLLNILAKCEVVSLVQEETYVVMAGKNFEKFVLMCNIWHDLSINLPGNVEVLPTPTVVV